MKKNKIICGDCLDVLKTIESESIDLIYMDPPFSSNQDYTNIWKPTGEELGFDDSWESGVKGYIELLMSPCLKECHRVLKQTGSIYVHCDWHANAHIRLALDDVFCAKNFRNEIIWYYYNKYSAGTKCFPRANDTIYFYSKTDNNFFNPLRIKREEPVRQLMRENVNGVLKNKKDDHGKVMYQISTDKKMDNVWKISCLQYASNETLGYPTQKPEALLERIIKASSNPGDLILDPFCGCGTTVAVSAKLGRQFIGIDVSRMAIKVMDNRLKELRNECTNDFDYEVIFPETIKDIEKYDHRNFQDWVCEKLGSYKGKKGADKGIDGRTYHKDTVIYDSVRKQKEILPEDTLIQVKHHEGSIGVPTLKEFESTIRHNKKDVGIVVAWDFASTTGEFSLELEDQGIKLYLVKAEDLFKQESLSSPYKEEYKVDRQMRLNK